MERVADDGQQRALDDEGGEGRPCSAGRADVLPAALSRTEFRRRIVETRRAGCRWKPDLYIVAVEGRRFVVKDYADKEFAFRWCVGRFSIGREISFYRRLQGLPGIADVAYRIDRYAIAVSEIAGRNGAQVAVGELSEAFFLALREVIDSVHRCGVVLCDLRNIKNILLGDDGRPYLVDFCTAFSQGGRWNIVRRGLFRIFAQDDLLGIAKLKRERAPHLFSDADRQALARGLFLERPARWLRDWGRQGLRFLFGWGKWTGSNAR